MPIRSSLFDHLVIATVLSTTFLIFNYSMHRIEEGHVGVYYRVCKYTYFLCISIFTCVILGWRIIRRNKFPGISYDDAFINNF